jgi:lactate dehydrogenase-like 2-hydroxyacid dehydrogenase
VTDKPDILVFDRLLAGIVDKIAAFGRPHPAWAAPSLEALVTEHGARVRGIATSGSTGASAALMDRLPKLEIVSCFGVGYDAIDVKHATKRGIVVTNTPGVLSDATAETALALLMALLRRVVAADRYLRAGKWLEKPYPLADQLAGRRVGILGLGRIGKEIAARCAAFKMTVAYCGRTRQPDQPYRYFASIGDMARNVDVLILSAPGTAETRRIVDRAVMAALGPKGALINVARGSLVDEAAMVEMLASGALGGAGLDVYESEPRVPPALFALENVVLLPHVGSATHETRAAMGQLVVDNLAAHFAGKKALTPVS